MNRTASKAVAILGKIPPDVREALADQVNLLDELALRDLGALERSGITHGLTSAMSGVDPDLLDTLTGLQSIVSIGAGLDRFDLTGFYARGITLHATPRVMSEDTAECAVGLVFALLRNIVSNHRFVHSGAWASLRAPLGWRVSERSVGVVGLGRIGSKVASKLSALGCDVSYTGRIEKPVPWRFEVDIHDLASRVDVLILCCAGGDETRGLVSSEVLNLLGPQGFLVNVSRGSVVNETALLAALENDLIAGAALDVFDNEPTPDPAFLRLQNCILQPHAAVYTHENRRDLIIEIRHLLGA